MEAVTDRQDEPHEGVWQATLAGRHLKGRRKKDTEPEILLRSALHKLGGRFRLHPHLARGCTPDLVLPKRRIAVFVDGDFWHGCPKHSKKPVAGPNAELWKNKMKQNRLRDERSSRLAAEAGWIVVRVWECDVRRNPVAVASALLEPPVDPASSISTRPVQY